MNDYRQNGQYPPTSGVTSRLHGHVWKYLSRLARGHEWHEHSSMSRQEPLNGLAQQMPHWRMGAETCRLAQILVAVFCCSLGCTPMWHEASHGRVVHLESANDTVGLSVRMVSDPVDVSASDKASRSATLTVTHPSAKEVTVLLRLADLRVPGGPSCLARVRVGREPVMLSLVVKVSEAAGYDGHIALSIRNRQTESEGTGSLLSSWCGGPSGSEAATQICGTQATWWPASAFSHKQLGCLLGVWSLNGVGTSALAKSMMSTGPMNHVIAPVDVSLVQEFHIGAWPKPVIALSASLE